MPAAACAEIVSQEALLARVWPGQVVGFKQSEAQGLEHSQAVMTALSKFAWRRPATEARIKVAPLVSAPICRNLDAMSYRNALNVFELQKLARRRLPSPLYSYIEGGVEDNQARDNNWSVFQRIRLRQRSPVDVSRRSQSVELLPPMTGEMWSGRGAVDWDLMRFPRDQWKGALPVKGILHSADAEMAVRVGLDGVVVSNHGGRQLDGAVSPIEAIPEIRAAAGGKLKILADSGFRRGTDILKGLALGADFILLGRPAMFAVAAGGEEGVVHALSLLKAEVDNDLGPGPAGLPVGRRSGPELPATGRPVSARPVRPPARAHAARTERGRQGAPGGRRLLSHPVH